MNENKMRTMKVFTKNLLKQFMDKYDALRDLAPFVQSKKRGKHPQKSVNFSVNLECQLY